MNMTKAAPKAVSDSAMLNWLKWLAVIAIIVTGISANVFFSNQPLVFRLVGIITLAAIAAFIAFSTSQGTRAWAFMKAARTELRKVVWPTRPETVQVTFVVICLVILTALILWGIDSVLLKLMAMLTGTKGA